MTEARLAVAAAQARELAAARRLDDHAQSILREQATAGSDHLDDLAMWLEHARGHSDRLGAALDRERFQVAALRQALARCRTEAELVEKAGERVAIEAALKAARREQSVMDEVAGGRGRAVRLPGAV